MNLQSEWKNHLLRTYWEPFIENYADALYFFNLKKNLWACDMNLENNNEA